MHCPALVQVICAELLKTWGQKGFESHVAQVQNFYKDQRNKMLKAAETHLTGLGEFRRIHFQFSLIIRMKQFVFSGMGRTKSWHVHLDETKWNRRYSITY